MRPYRFLDRNSQCSVISLSNKFFGHGSCKSPYALSLSTVDLEVGLQGHDDNDEGVDRGTREHLPQPRHRRHGFGLHGPGDPAHPLLGEGHGWGKWAQRHQQPILGESGVMQRTNAGQSILKFLLPHTIVSWNVLPQAVVSSPTLEVFKTALSLTGDIVITL